MTIFHCSACSFNTTDVYLAGEFKCILQDGTEVLDKVVMEDNITGFVYDNYRVDMKRLSMYFTEELGQKLKDIEIISCSGFCQNCFQEIYTYEK